LDPKYYINNLMFYKKLIIKKVKKRALFDFLDSFDTESINSSSNIKDERSLKEMEPTTIVENNNVDCNDSLDEDYDNEMKYIFDNLSDISDEDSEFESESVPTETNMLNQNIMKINSKLTSIDTNDKVKVIKSQKKRVSSARKSSVNNRKCILNILKKMRRNRF